MQKPRRGAARLFPRLGEDLKLGLVTCLGIGSSARAGTRVSWLRGSFHSSRCLSLPKRLSAFPTTLKDNGSSQVPLHFLNTESFGRIAWSKPKDYRVWHWDSKMLQGTAALHDSQAKGAGPLFCLQRQPAGLLGGSAQLLASSYAFEKPRICRKIGFMSKTAGPVSPRRLPSFLGRIAFLMLWGLRLLRILTSG